MSENVGIQSRWKPINDSVAFTCTDNIVSFSGNIPDGASGALITVRGDATNTDQSAAIAFQFKTLADTVPNVAQLRSDGQLFQHNEKYLISSKAQLLGFSMVSYEAAKTQEIRVQFFTNAG